MFKRSFKYYKSKKPLPSLEDVLDMNKSGQLLKDSKIERCFIDSKEYCHLLGLKPPGEWEIFQIVNHPGLIFVKNPFTSVGQRYWTVKCLKDYTKKPNKMNIDGSDKIIANSDFWEIAQHDRNILMSLRWTTLGYHHNWNTKHYNEAEREQFPEELKKMIEYIANQLGYTDFVAEAAIVNYYQMNSTLSGHTDHSENNLNAPLFSLSFGQTAIFLIGGKTLEEKPTSLFLRSGDIIIMSKESRLAYHAVPKIIHTEITPWKINNDCTWENDNNEMQFLVDESDWKPFGEYLEHSRINVNVRQVV
nr:nucleic acid dioxygenase ALKBH1 [Leptinotarsa decemlineata]